MAAAYGEIGIQAGILLAKDFLSNVENQEESHKSEYHYMYHSLFREVTKALDYLQGVENAAVEKAVEVLKSGQSAAEEYFMKSGNRTQEQE